MKIAVIGGTGLLGSAIMADLTSRGHSVISMSRSAGVANPEEIRVDLNNATSPSYWLRHLDGIEAVVNCAGVLQDSPNDSSSMVHHHGIANLFTACEQLKIRRVIHFFRHQRRPGNSQRFFRNEIVWRQSSDGSGPRLDHFATFGRDRSRCLWSQRTYARLSCPSGFSGNAEHGTTPDRPARRRRTNRGSLS